MVPLAALLRPRLWLRIERSVMIPAGNRLLLVPKHVPPLLPIAIPQRLLDVMSTMGVGISCVLGSGLQPVAKQNSLGMLYHIDHTP